MIKSHPATLPLLALFLMPFAAPSLAQDAEVITDSIRNLKVHKTKWTENPEVTLLSKTIDLYPCMDCHASMEPNPTQRKLTSMHEDIKFEHNKTFTWCLDCHDMQDRNKLRLISGKHVPYAESYRICAQCHGEKFRDWKIGIHGLRTGGWNRPKTMRNCAICHDPHKPKFEKMKPDPVPHPRRPRFGDHVEGHGEGAP